MEKLNAQGITTGDAEQPAKKRKLLFSDGHSDDESHDESQDNLGFTVNADYARRFEHNKKRVELSQLEEKYGKANGLATYDSKHGDGHDALGSDESSSSEEDDEGILATEALDAEISSTLQAIRSKDPRVYDSTVAFYSKVEEDAAQLGQTEGHKPMYLRDYHRMNLLQGQTTGNEVQDNDDVKTYAQEQDDLRRGLVSEMHKAANGVDGEHGDEDANADENDDGFFTAKEKPEADAALDKKSEPFADEDAVAAMAEKDPDLFLSNYMSSRAWVPLATSRFAPLESDDDEEDERAEEFEQAFNLRFEDPAHSNEKLISHARDAAAKYSVRREELTGRKRARELEREKKEMQKRELEQEKSRLRKLKIEENEARLRKIKEAAGLRGESIRQEDWMTFLDEAWDMEQWEKEMQRRFGDTYYAEKDEVERGGDKQGDDDGKRKKPRKPKWDDDIDINDLVPDFDGHGPSKPSFDSSEAEPDDAAPEDGPDDEDEQAEDAGRRKAKAPKKKDLVRMRKERKKAARLERRAIEEMVDEKLDQAGSSLLPSGTKMAPFRYRETSPVTYGLTAQDILMADDAQLNQYVGLKKLATFRDPQKKRKDKKRLGKKARLRQWRRDTFGTDQQPELGAGVGSPVARKSAKGREQHPGNREGKRKRRKVEHSQN